MFILRDVCWFCLLEKHGVWWEESEMKPEGCFDSCDRLRSIYMTCLFETCGDAIRSVVVLAKFLLRLLPLSMIKMSGNAGR